jgi:hypothetical protein
MRTVLAVLAAVVSIAAAKTYLEESFNDGAWGGGVGREGLESVGCVER